MNSYTLSNGITIPAIGFGTWQTPDGEVAIDSVVKALEAGYRHIDTAAIYGNEKSVGVAIQKSDIDRKDVFITSKLWNSERGYDKTLAAFQKSLHELQTDYLDLYLIHWPANSTQFANNWKEMNGDTWKAIEFLYDQGKIKAIGVSNFQVKHLAPLLEKAKHMPMVNQIEFHPGLPQTETLTFCNQHNILIEAWGPMGTGKLIGNPTLQSIAQNYNVSVAQLCIKWCLQNHTLPLPKSITPSRIIENLSVDHFTISAEDMNTINQLPFIGGSGLDSDTIAF